MQPLTKREAAQLGVELRRSVLSNYAFKRAIEVLESGYTQEFLSSGYLDEKTREQAYRKYHALHDLMSTLNTFEFYAIQETDAEDDTTEEEDLS